MKLKINRKNENPPIRHQMMEKVLTNEGKTFSKRNVIQLKDAKKTMEEIYDQQKIINWIRKRQITLRVKIMIKRAWRVWCSHDILKAIWLKVTKERVKLKGNRQRGEGRIERNMKQMIRICHIYPRPEWI